MTRADVERIMGRSQLRYRAQVADQQAGLRIESGECWDDGGVPKAYFDHLRRRLGFLKSFKTRAEYRVEIRFNDADRVEAIEIRDQRK